MYRLKLDNNKYKIIEDLEHGIFKAERYDEEWRDLVGDNLVLSLVNKIQELENENSTLKDKLRRKKSFIKRSVARTPVTLVMGWIANILNKLKLMLD